MLISIPCGSLVSYARGTSKIRRTHIEHVTGTFLAHTSWTFLGHIYTRTYVEHLILCFQFYSTVLG